MARTRLTPSRSAPRRTRTCRCLRGRSLPMDKRWIVLAVLFVVRAATGFQFQSIGSVASLLTEDFHVGFAEIGALIGAYLLPGVFVAMPGGMLSSRWGDRAICVSG